MSAFTTDYLRGLVKVGEDKRPLYINTPTSLSHTIQINNVNF